MKKIPTLFQRNYDTDRLVRNEVVPGCEWVLAGEGVATEKIDGTCCRIQDGKLYKRYELKRGKVTPTDFVPAQDADPVTGDIPGWLPVGEGPEDRWHREAFGLLGWRDGSYELIGPKVQGNPYRLEKHDLERHGAHVLDLAPRTFDELKAYLEANAIEGLVWWRDLFVPDCDKVKLKRRDFGFEWPIKEK